MGYLSLTETVAKSVEGSLLGMSLFLAGCDIVGENSNSEKTNLSGILAAAVGWMCFTQCTFNPTPNGLASTCAPVEF